MENALLSAVCAVAMFLNQQHRDMQNRMSETEIVERDKRNGRFIAGNSGNGGRRPGARNRLGEQYLADLADCWQKHGAAALEACAITEPAQFCRIIASLLPRQAELSVDVSVLHDVTSTLEAFRTLTALVGADPKEREAGMRKLRQLAPQLEYEP
jgi:hypothetical protein